MPHMVVVSDPITDWLRIERLHVLKTANVTGMSLNPYYAWSLSHTDS